MKVLYWNVRSIANQNSRLMLNKFCDSHRPDLLFLSEPWIDIEQIPSSFWAGIKLKPFVLNDRGSFLPNLWGLCADHLNPVFILSSKQQISFSLVWEQQTIYITAVYASTNNIIRRDLWNELEDLQCSSGPWVLVGDFNSILGAHEQRGGGMPNATACEESRSWAENCNLIHLPPRGAAFTWSNRRQSNSLIERRLDRALCNENWLSFWSSTSCCTLTRSNLDHHSLLVVLKEGRPTFPSSFKFQRMSIQHSDCRRLAMDIWN